MKNLIVCVLLLILVAVGVSGCSGFNWSTAMSIGVDIAQLRADREAAGKGHIEDVFVTDETTGEEK